MKGDGDGREASGGKIEKEGKRKAKSGDNGCWSQLRKRGLQGRRKEEVVQGGGEYWEGGEN